MHRGDRFTSDRTPPTPLSPAALTRGWKLIGSLHCQLLLPKWKSTPDASQRRIWFLGGLKHQGQQRGLHLPTTSLVLQHSRCPARTDQRGEDWATKTWAHQTQQVGAVEHCCLSWCPSCCLSCCPGASAPTHCTQSTHRHSVPQARPFLGMKIPNWFPIPKQHTSPETPAKPSLI